MLPYLYLSATDRIQERRWRREAYTVAIVSRLARRILPMAMHADIMVPIVKMSRERASKESCLSKVKELVL